MADIGKYDKNLKVETKLPNVPDICFRNACEPPFCIHGLWQPRVGRRFCRMPEELAESVNETVGVLNLHTSGGRVRFVTDSSYVAIKAEWDSQSRMGHMPLSGQCGFDLFEELGERSVYRASFMPTFACEKGYEGITRFGGERRLRSFTLNLPLYNGVNALYIGLQQDAVLSEGKPYAYDRPVVYYGSSITQGGCASRPGNCYQAIQSRRFGFDFVNLGFSGNAKGELCVAEHIASLDPLVFVMDYDHNAPNEQWLRDTHEPFFARFRALRPNTPVILVSSAMPGWNVRRAVVFATYEHALRAGDAHVAFVDGAAMYAGSYAECATVDGCHPNDYGFVCMADRIGAVLETVLPPRKF